MALRVGSEISTAQAVHAHAALARLAAGGFTAANALRFAGAQVASDLRYLRPPPERPRRGAGAWLALLIHGEEIDGAPELEPLVACGLVERAGERLRARAAIMPVATARGDLWLASDRFDDVSADGVAAPDLSALNLLGCLPSRADGLRALDIGCGAGIASLALARAGARVLGSDVDARALAWARYNAALNRVDVAFAEGDLFAAAGDQRWDLLTFNAPLLRAPVAASDPTVAPRYLTSPRGESLALDFLAGLAARLAPSGEALLHAQLTPAVEAALASLAEHAQVVSARFAVTLDVVHGATPHALVSIRAGAAERRDAWVPLSPACPMLARPLLDGLHGPRALAPDVTPRPAPWLELRESRAFGRPSRALSFGGVPIDDATRALLERLTGENVRELALDDDDRGRLAQLLAAGHVILE